MKNKPRPQPTDDQFRALARLEQLEHEYVIGIDEVGYGAWAGPLTVGGVVLRRGVDHPSFRDSKSFTAKRRQYAYRDVAAYALVTYLESSEPVEIDSMSVGVCLEELVCKVACRLMDTVSSWGSYVVVFDGDRPPSVPGLSYENMAWMPSADALVPAVSAASIYAKVTRDEDMKIYGDVFPDYDFKSNKGYHSSRHVEGLRLKGPCAIHRKTYRPVKDYMHVLESRRLWHRQQNETPA